MSCYLIEYETSDGDFDFCYINADDYLGARDIFDANYSNNEVLHVYMRLF